MMIISILTNVLIVSALSAFPLAVLQPERL